MMGKHDDVWIVHTGTPVTVCIPQHIDVSTIESNQSVVVTDCYCNSLLIEHKRKHKHNENQNL